MFTWKSWTVNQHTFDNVRQWYTSAVSILQEVRRRLSAVLSLLGRRFKHLPCMSSLLVELQELCDSLLYFWGDLNHDGLSADFFECREIYVDQFSFWLSSTSEESWQRSRFSVRGDTADRIGMSRWQTSLPQPLTLVATETKQLSQTPTTCQQEVWCA